jgi:hypothetical protein
MIFESDGGTYECTGSLIQLAVPAARSVFHDRQSLRQHCEEARSLISLFNYQTPVCGGTPPTLGSLPRVNGATLIAGQPMALGDFTLLQLNAFPNVDVKVLGWYSDPIGAAEQVTGISHPSRRLQAYFVRTAHPRRELSVSATASACRPASAIRSIGCKG